jgi:CubicO group peptidase (beta-lactamase class C family)
MLLTHTAGFAYPMSDKRINSWSLEEQTLVFEPGAGWVYSVMLIFQSPLTLS